MHILFATRDGQSRRIAERIALRLTAIGVDPRLMDLGNARPTPNDLKSGEPIIVLAAVRYGKHLPEAEQFLADYKRLASPPPLVLLSVNLTARKPGKDTAEGNVYLRKLIHRHGLKPALAQAIPGRLDYARYTWLDRQLIRFIMVLTGGPTDPTACVEYTVWDKVDALADRIAELPAVQIRRVTSDS